MDDDDDDVPYLSGETFAALQEFYAEQDKKRKVLEKLNDDIQNIQLDEDWQLSQFWYDEETVNSLVGIANKVVPDGGRVALISCPTLFVPIKRQVEARAQVILLEFDRRFEIHAPSFVYYNYNEPENLPPELEAKLFDLVIADPPFLSSECLSKVSLTIQYLAKDKVIVCTGTMMEDVVKKYLGLRKCVFVPKHRNNLANEFSCYANFNLDELNTDKSKDDRSKLLDVRSKASDGLSKVLEDSAKAADNRSKASDDRSRTSDGRSKAPDDSTKAADDRSKTPERSKATDDRSKASDDRSKATDDRSKASDDNIKILLENSVTSHDTRQVNDSPPSPENAHSSYDVTPDSYFDNETSQTMTDSQSLSDKVIIRHLPPRH